MGILQRDYEELARIKSTTQEAGCDLEVSACLASFMYIYIHAFTVLQVKPFL